MTVGNVPDWAAGATIRVNGHDSCYIRPVIYLGYGEMGLNPLPSKPAVSIATWEWGTYLGEDALTKGVRVMISSYRRIGKNTIPPASKTNGQYINSSLAKVEALRAGYDEAIMLSEDGYLAEGTGENLFVIQNLTGRSIFEITRMIVPYFLILVLAVILLTAFPGIATWLVEQTL